MNVIQLQDMLRGLPDDRLKQELSQPTGTVPQYLVLSEVVRRDKMRDSAAAAPQSTVVQDVIGTPTAPQAMPGVQAYAGGGFVTPAQAMGNAGIRGFEPQQPKQPTMFGTSPSGPQMFTPNTTPQPPAPITNNNVTMPPPTVIPPSPQPDGGQEDGPNAPSFYEQSNGYADGGIIGLSNGGGTRDVIVSRLQGLGYTPAAIAAILGAAEAESSFNPKAKGAAGEVGIFQWRGPRLDALKQFAESRGGDIYDPTIQTDFLDNELRTTEGRAGKILFSAQTPEDAALGMMHYERPAGYTRDNPTAGHNWSGRLGAAQNYYNTLFDGQTTAPSASNIPAPNQEAASPMMNPADLASGILSGGVMPDPRKRGIGSFFADALKAPGAQKDMRELGASLFAKGQENTAPEAPGITRGDASLAQSISGRSPEEILAEYQALRTGYMANGGAVRMAEGGQPPLKPKVRYNAITGTYVDENGRLLTREEALAVTPDQLTTAPLEPEGTFEAPPAQAPALKAPSFAPTAYGFDLLRPFTEPTKKEAGYVPTEAQTREAAQERGPETRRTPSQSAGAAELVRRARFAAEEAPEESSAFNDYLSYLKERDKQLADMYQQQAEEERRRQEEAGGLPFLLRQLGIGMISSGGNLQQGLRGGLQQAFQAREEQTQAARDRIRELQLKGQMAGIEGAGDVAKLRYEAEVAADKAASEGRAGQTDYLKSYNDAVQAYAKAVGEGASPEEIKLLASNVRYFGEKAGVPSSAGLGAVDPAALEEARRRGIIQ